MYFSAGAVLIRASHLADAIAGLFSILNVFPKRAEGNSVVGMGAASSVVAQRPVGLMDKASASGAGDSRFESWAGHCFICLLPG